jgi:hypothetical protein
MKINRHVIPQFAAFVQSVQYSVAGYFLAGWVGVFALGLMGALISLSIVYASSQLAEVAKARRIPSILAMVALMLFSPVIIGSATYLHLPQVNPPIWRGVVSAAWGTLPDLAVALAGFVAGKGLIDSSSSTANSSSRSATVSTRSKPAGTRSATQKARSAATSDPQSDVKCRWHAAGCTRTGTQGSMNAHSPKCRYNPAKAAPQNAHAKVEL